MLRHRISDTAIVRGHDITLYLISDISMSDTVTFFVMRWLRLVGSLRLQVSFAE